MQKCDKCQHDCHCGENCDCENCECKSCRCDDVKKSEREAGFNGC